MDDIRIALVLLNKNEVQGCKEILPKIDVSLFSAVAFVDGHSTDGSLEFLLQGGLKQIGQESPGRGAAMQQAFLFLQEECDAIIFLSMDGNEDPSDLPIMIGLLRKGYDLVIGNRMSEGGINEEDTNLFKPRKWVNQLFALLIYIIFGKRKLKIKDPINGYRAFRSDAWNRLSLTETGFGVEFQSSIRAYKRNLKYVEFPTHELPRLGGKSSAKSIPTGLRFLKIVVYELFTAPKP